MTGANAVETTGLTVEHRVRGRTILALDHPPLRLDGGTSLSVMGPSGCGKSTLLGLLAGLAVPTSGSVVVGGTEISALAEPDRVRFRRDHLGMVYQADNLLPYLTVEENVALSLAVSGAGDHLDDAPAEVLERVGLADLATRFPDQLSGGQRQRVAVARAVVHRPLVLLADEPTGALDGDNATAVIELLTERQRAIGATLVLVTHDPAIASHADRTLQLAVPAQPEGTADAR